MITILHDLRYAARMLLKSPGFSVAALLTLLICIGANTAIFSVVNATFLRELPYPDADRLLWMTERNSTTSRNGAVSYPNFLDWRAQQDSFSELSIYQIDNGTLRTTDGMERVPILFVSRGFFSTWGVHVLQGRSMMAEDDQAAAAPVAWLSYAAWQRYFTGESALVGRTISIDGREATVAGILPADFKFVRQADVYLPLAPYAEHLGVTTRTNRASTFVIGLLKPDVTLESAQAQMDTIARRLQSEYPQANAGIVPNVMPLREHAAGGARTQLFLLLGAVGTVLLIVCVNLANMLLARSAVRQREMAIRAGLGASRVQMMRQLLVESLRMALGASRREILREVVWRGFRLVLPGIFLGLIGAWGVGRLLQSSLFGVTGGDPATFVSCAAVFLLVAFAACLLPAGRAMRIDPTEALRCE